ncbi:MAG: hypothetical protein HUJ51_04830 [Eggerthellaceae bacterium]|nr:hypothetical protein [Eggerthellaceae bacterium]
MAPRYTFSIKTLRIYISQIFSGTMSPEMIDEIHYTHTEGILIYCSSLPYAIYIRDVEDSIFYGADHGTGLSRQVLYKT